MKRADAGFSLLENIVAAGMVAFVLLGMSGLLGAYTVNQAKMADVPFAYNLAQQQLDEVQMSLTTQNSLIFDNNTACAWCPRGRGYVLRNENINVTRYYFDNFPLDWPVPRPQDNSMEPIRVPWPPTGTTSAALISAANYTTEGVAFDKPYIQFTRFYRNRFYSAGGDLVTNVDEPLSPTEVRAKLTSADPAEHPRYAVRMQLLGIPAASEGAIADMGAYIARAHTLRVGDYNLGDLRQPPDSTPYLIGDSCINGASESIGDERGTGVIFIAAPPAFGVPAGGDHPAFFQHFTSKILVARVYRIDDFLDDETFFNAAQTVPDREIASASVLLVGRVQLR
ncbi:MAG: type II secretion system protein [Cyanobacteria bacterium NC_groundwater_1444_Ag_S-0.65um_54_12]|nr:type II secretion system protein [Cyanobacteria bacterium NC_groundwater_1444_Ag_S-0.65um_54_12]